MLAMDRQVAGRLGVVPDPDRQVTTLTFLGPVHSGIGRLEGAAWVGGVGIQGGDILIENSRQKVGGDFLKHFVVTIDMVASRIEFRPPATPSDRVVFREQRGQSSSSGN